MNQKDLHDKVLYPVTRVKTGKAGGSVAAAMAF